MPKIVIAAFDGLQRSQVSPELMPIVTALADKGVRFEHNHAVFPTVTRANSASLVTGVTPGTHGLTANKSVFHEYSTTEVVDALIPKLPEINNLTNGELLFVPTLGELISQKNLKWVSVVGGTSGNAFVQHPNAAEYGDVIIHPEFTNPPEHHSIITNKFGAWPPKEAPAAALVERTADVAIEYALSELNPDVLLVWFPEPDTSQHAYGVDSDEARQMYSLADSNLGRLLESISKNGEEPDVFVVSDHGYSTIDSVVDVHAELASAGFGPDQGERSVIVAGNGGSVLLYLPAENDQLAVELVDWLDAQEWVGAIATDVPAVAESKFASISDIGLAGPRSPDVVVTMRSIVSGQPAPLERSGAATGGVVGVGSHGGSSPAELHNTLIASGPSFLTGVDSKIASGNIDVAPTVLEILGIPIPSHMDGRTLSESLVDGTTPMVPVASNSSEPSPKVRTVTEGSATYLCEFG
ncbi:MAG: alkaline phosphatase family protein [Chloroflexi bacterium]|jgi:phosphonoacetate hydrolase|nr:alkaline phosphatase family protein [Chloroflexota bacterium]